MTSIKGLGQKVLLVIFDGFGINPDSPKNAIQAANTPNIDAFFKDYPFTTIEASGTAVGLPKGVMGNSEVGHLNLGAGRPVRQDLVRINEVIANNTFSELPKMKELINHSKKKSKRIHLMGLLSDGGVHSHIDHLKEIIKILSENEDLEIFFHAFMDGRDTPQKSGIKYIEDLEKVPGFTFASMQGRSIGMDRDRRWEKIEAAYKTFTGDGPTKEISPIEYLKEEYEKGIFDEFITPNLFNKNYAIGSSDSVFFINFRPDRAIQISMAFNDPDFKEFERKIIPSYFLCMSPYIDEDVDLPILFNKEKISGGLSEFISKKGLKQFKIAETEKYAHVTYFFNGGEKKPFEGEEHVLVPSPREVETYDEKPQMSAPEVTQKLTEALQNNNHDVYIVNFANSDMIGHTGNYDAAVSSIETLDDCLKKLIDVCQEEDLTFILTADHGNSDQMIYADGTPHTSHTTAKVPFCVFNKKLKGKKLKINGEKHALKDVAPTILYIMGIEPPESFSGVNVFV